MAHGGNFGAGKKMAQQWSQAHPHEAQELRSQAKNRDRKLAVTNMMYP
jgi:ABC-type nitrate/sulfonate/bicarbonate transport system substrate-binding protein